ncbi:hypothetical protein AAC387_Pa12g2220 [Persea americana]
MQNEVGVETLLHLAVTSMTMEMIDHALDTANAKGTNNILALKGDPVKGKDPAQDPLQCALGLWVPQDVLASPISHGVYSCKSQLVYAAFCDAKIGYHDVLIVVGGCPKTFPKL